MASSPAWRSGREETALGIPPPERGIKKKIRGRRRGGGVGLVGGGEVRPGGKNARKTQEQG